MSTTTSTTTSPLPAPHPILVAVDGSEGSDAAVRYGAAEAMRLGLPLELLHVVPDYLPVAALVPLSTPLSIGDAEGLGREVVEQALRIARDILPAEQVSGTVAVGQRVPALLDASVRARLLVLGDDRTPVLERLAVGSVIGSVAPRAPIPVVSVPAKWSPEERSGRVVLGIKEYDRVPQVLLEAAFQIAGEHSATLEIAYVWELSATYGAIISSTLDYPGWQAMVDHELRAAVAVVRDQFPHVSFVTSAWHGQPAQILRERSADADLLILARRSHGFPLGHFGSTGRALLRESRCPVEVLPLPETDPVLRHL